MVAPDQKREGEVQHHTEKGRGVIVRTKEGEIRREVAANQKPEKKVLGRDQKREIEGDGRHWKAKTKTKKEKEKEKKLEVTKRAE